MTVFRVNLRWGDGWATSLQPGTNFTNRGSALRLRLQARRSPVWRLKRRWNTGGSGTAGLEALQWRPSAVGGLARAGGKVDALAHHVLAEQAFLLFQLLLDAVHAVRIFGCGKVGGGGRWWESGWVGR